MLMKNALIASSSHVGKNTPRDHTTQPKEQGVGKHWAAAGWTLLLSHWNTVKSRCASGHLAKGKGIYFDSKMS